VPNRSAALWWGSCSAGPSHGGPIGLLHEQARTSRLRCCSRPRRGPCCATSTTRSRHCSLSLGRSWWGGAVLLPADVNLRGAAHLTCRVGYFAGATPCAALLGIAFQLGVARAGWCPAVTLGLPWCSGRCSGGGTCRVVRRVLRSCRGRGGIVHGLPRVILCPTRPPVGRLIAVTVTITLLRTLLVSSVARASSSASPAWVGFVYGRPDGAAATAIVGPSTATLSVAPAQRVAPSLVGVVSSPSGGATTRVYEPKRWRSRARRGAVQRPGMFGAFLCRGCRLRRPSISRRTIVCDGGRVYRGH